MMEGILAYRLPVRRRHLQISEYFDHVPANTAECSAVKEELVAHYQGERFQNRPPKKVGHFDEHKIHSSRLRRFHKIVAFGARWNT